jgi:hypothetical protein
VEAVILPSGNHPPLTENMPLTSPQDGFLDEYPSTPIDRLYDLYDHYINFSFMTGFV